MKDFRNLKVAKSSSSLKKIAPGLSSIQNVITSVEGEKVDVNVTSSGITMSGFGLTEYWDQILASHLVYGDANEVYIYEIFPYLPTQSYIKGVKVTVPDTYSAAVTPECVTLPGTDVRVGRLSAVIDTPYVLTEEGIYVGYSLTVPAVPKGESLTDMQQNPILLSPCNNPESLYIRASKDFLKWLPYNGNLQEHGVAGVLVVTGLSRLSANSMATTLCLPLTMTATRCRQRPRVQRRGGRRYRHEGC